MGLILWWQQRSNTCRRRNSSSCCRRRSGRSRTLFLLQHMSQDELTLRARRQPHGPPYPMLPRITWITLCQTLGQPIGRQTSWGRVTYKRHANHTVRNPTHSHNSKVSRTGDWQAMVEWIAKVGFFRQSQNFEVVLRGNERWNQKGLFWD